MLQEFVATNRFDNEGNPTGGTVRATGLVIDWQKGPLGRGNERQEPNGAFVETVIAAAVQRLEFYQEAAHGKFACPENASAIHHLESALFNLNLRTSLREERQVEGTYQV